MDEWIGDEWIGDEWIGGGWIGGWIGSLDECLQNFDSSD